METILIAEPGSKEYELALQGLKKTKELASRGIVVKIGSSETLNKTEGWVKLDDK